MTLNTIKEVRKKAGALFCDKNGKQLCFGFKQPGVTDI